MARHIPLPARNCKHCAGFTLIELSVVMLIAATLIGMSMYTMRGKMDEAQLTQTNLKLDQIEKALIAYRRTNNTLPCPASLTLPQSDPNYSVAAANPGRCIGGTPSATLATANVLNLSPTSTGFNAVEGGVPYQALNLPESFMFDGWGRHINYAVDPRMTEEEAFTNYDIYGNCGGISVVDATGQSPARSTAAVYALLSFGPDGHGAYMVNGSRYSAGSTNTDQLTNCNCDSGANPNPPPTPPNTYGATYVQKDPTTSPSVFDDIVRYKERWQMQVQSDSTYSAYVGPEVGFALATTPYTAFYTKSCDTWTAMATTGTAPTVPDTSGTGLNLGAAHSIAVSKDDAYWAVAHTNSPYTTIFQRNSGNGSLTAMTSPFGANGPTGTGLAVAFSPTETFFAIGSDDATPSCSPNCVYLRVYLLSNGSFTYLTSGNNGPPTSSLPTSKVNTVAFSPNDQYLAAGYATSPYLSLYNVSNNFTTVTAPTITSAVNALAFSPDGKYFAVGLNAAPYWYVYNNGTFTTSGLSYDNSGGSGPGSAVTGVSFSSDYRYMALTTNNTTHSLYIYRINPVSTPTFQLVVPLSGATSSYGGLNGVAFSPNQHLLAQAGTSSAITKYIPIEDDFVLQSQSPPPGLTPPAQAANAAALRYPH